jgi:hypothetical protein
MTIGDEYIILDGQAVELARVQGTRQGNFFYPELDNNGYLIRIRKETAQERYHALRGYQQKVSDDMDMDFDDPCQEEVQLKQELKQEMTIKPTQFNPGIKPAQKTPGRNIVLRIDETRFDCEYPTLTLIYAEIVRASSYDPKRSRIINSHQKMQRMESPHSSYLESNTALYNFQIQMCMLNADGSLYSPEDAEKQFSYGFSLTTVDNSDQAQNMMETLMAVENQLAQCHQKPSKDNNGDLIAMNEFPQWALLIADALGINEFVWQVNDKGQEGYVVINRYEASLYLKLVIKEWYENHNLKLSRMQRRSLFSHHNRNEPQVPTPGEQQ